MAAKQQWRCVYPGSPEIDEFPSKAKAYEWVGSLRHTYGLSLRQASALWDPIPNPTVALTVQIDDGLGTGWQPYEHINFADKN